MLTRPKPKQISEAAAAAIMSTAADPGASRGSYKSYDPTNFPVFETPINQKILAYVPNHTVVDAEGNSKFRADEFFAHPVIDGKTYSYIRCINGVHLDEASNAELHYKENGECPFCNAVQECWSLVNYTWKAEATAQGYDPANPAVQEQFKPNKKKYIEERVVKEADAFITFPIVVVECEEKDGKLTTTPKIGSDNQLHGTTYWYTTRRNSYESKWLSAIEDADLDTDHLGGRWLVLDYTVDKGLEENKMNSARSLQVRLKANMDAYADWAKYFDQLTEAWTPGKAQEVVVYDAVRSYEELEEAVDSIMAHTRELLSMFETGYHARQDQQRQLGTNNVAALEQFTEQPTAQPVPPVAPPAGIPSAPTAPVGVE